MPNMEFEKKKDMQVVRPPGFEPGLPARKAGVLVQARRRPHHVHNYFKAVSLKIYSHEPSGSFERRKRVSLPDDNTTFGVVHLSEPADQGLLLVEG